MCHFWKIAKGCVIPGALGLLFCLIQMNALLVGLVKPELSCTLSSQIWQASYTASNQLWSKLILLKNTFQLACSNMVQERIPNRSIRELHCEEFISQGSHFFFLSFVSWKTIYIFFSVKDDFSVKIWNDLIKILILNATFFSLSNSHYLPDWIV